MSTHRQVHVRRAAFRSLRTWLTCWLAETALVQFRSGLTALSRSAPEPTARRETR